MNWLEMQTMRFEAVGSVLLLVQTKEHPTDAEWDAYLKYVARPEYRRLLVWSAGGTPQTGQRGRMRALLKEDARPAVVMADDPFARAAIAVVSLLFMRGLKGFALHQEKEALDHLGVPEPERLAVLGALYRLRDELKIR